MADKGIDLGKLQSALKVAQITHKAHETALSKAWSDLERARITHERWQKVVADDKLALSKAKQAVIDGARAVAQE